MKLFRRSLKQGQILDYNPPVDPAAMEQPADTAAYLRRGYAFYGVSNYADAAEDFRKALDLDLSAVDAVYGLGMSLKADGRKDEAVTALRKPLP